MAKTILLFITIFAISKTVFSNFSEWEEFKAKYGKTYATSKEENMRKEIFYDHLREVKMQDSLLNFMGERGYEGPKIGINGFADITWNEYQEMFNLKDGMIKPVNVKSVSYYEYKGLEVPDNVDQRTLGRVLPVRNQGSCGSCWAFSAAASLEGLLAIQTGNREILSVSNILECSNYAKNCNKGGDPFIGMEYAATIQGLDAESCYPYTYQYGPINKEYKKCSESANCKRKIEIKSPNAFMFKERDHQSMKEVVSVQPISVGILWTRELSLYDGKHIFYASASDCDQNSWNHAINIVGYGTSPEGDYWIVKNSHGTEWGDLGFGRIARGSNVCGIEGHSSFPNGGLI